ncbi:MAG: PHB depolymerase family esterase [Limisphaerales bacterium]
MKTFLATLLFAAFAVEAADLPPFTAGKSTVSFTELPKQAEPDEVKWRLHSVENPGAFDLSKEKFQLIVPTSYKHTDKWGVFIWISPGDTPSIPADWEPALAARKLLFIGAFKSGNPRSIFDRVRLAVAANLALRDRFNVDGRRVYVSGFSGGGRVASMVGVAYADMFSGAMPFMGVNFYEDIPAGDGKTTYGANFIPDDEVLAIAKKFCRYALVTGEKDFNRAGTKTVFEQGFKKEGFANVTYLEASGIAHSLPPAKWLEQGLEFLDTGKGVKPADAK